MSRFQMDDRVAIITGGGTGIGRGAALVLAEHGGDVVLAGRRLEPLESTVQEIEALGRRALAVPTDVSDPGQCQALVDATLAEFGRVDVLVNNAGGAETKSISKWTEDEYRQTMASTSTTSGSSPASRRDRCSSRVAAPSSTSRRVRACWPCPRPRSTARPRPPVRTRH